jgi:hypothetical protein
MQIRTTAKIKIMEENKSLSFFEGKKIRKMI